jgi:hypothetical protein
MRKLSNVYFMYAEHIFYNLADLQAWSNNYYVMYTLLVNIRFYLYWVSYLFYFSAWQLSLPLSKELQLSGAEKSRIFIIMIV